MGVGKVGLCSHGALKRSVKEVRMGHVAGPLCILLAEKEGRIWFIIMCFKFYIGLRELLGGVCLSWNMFRNLS